MSEVTIDDKGRTGIEAGDELIVTADLGSGEREFRMTVLNTSFGGKHLDIRTESGNELKMTIHENNPDVIVQNGREIAEITHTEVA